MGTAMDEVDQERPDPERCMTFEQSMALIRARYSEVIRQLGEM